MHAYHYQVIQPVNYTVLVKLKKTKRKIVK
jgi:hypothetical protein